MTRYEMVALLSARAVEIDNGAHHYTGDDKLSSIDIAKEEFEMGCLDHYEISRRAPDGASVSLTVGKIRRNF